MDYPMTINGNTYAWASSVTESDVTLTPEDTNVGSVIITNSTLYPVVVTAGASAATAAFPTSATVPVPCQIVLPSQSVTFKKRPGWSVISLIQGTADAGKYVYVTAHTGN